MSVRWRMGVFWWVTLAALVVAGATFSLGMWQLGRASAKEALLAQRETRAHGLELTQADLLAPKAPGGFDGLHDRPVGLQGHWLHDATVFLDNRPMNGRSGFIVVTPLQLPGRSEVVLVQRGWVPRRFDDRGSLPELPDEPGTVLVRGRLAPPPSKLYELGQEGSGRIRQNVDIGQLSQQLGRPVLAVSVLQAPSAGVNDGLTRDWPVVGGDAHKHLGYAFQWFGLSFLTVVLYVWFQIIAPRRRKG
jgi:surfeit locus 1 family protein